MESIVKPISESTIHQLCSSQVVVDLSTAVKELVENALDAGATCIEVKLKNMGADSIEVADNGSGIDPADYSGIAEKHQTSKLRTFEDLVDVSSFGFRGEALNALCELSGKFSVTTKRAVDTAGASLLFDRFGRLTSQNVAPRGNGTTVTVEKLFEVLPVRRSEFVRTIKKQYQRMLRILQSYSLYSVGTKFIVSNISNGTRQVVLSTQQSTKIDDNICTLFGAKFLATLVPFTFDVTHKDIVANNASTQEQDCEDEKVSSMEEESLGMAGEMEQGTPNKDSPPTYSATISGFVSKVGIGVGRNDNDRQFIFCNGRPVDLPKFIRALNEIWRRYEMKQKPAFILDIKLPHGSYDINVTPDKREVFLQHEESILEKLRQTIDELYAPSRNTFKITQPQVGDTTSLLSTPPISNYLSSKVSSPFSSTMSSGKEGNDESLTTSDSLPESQPSQPQQPFLTPTMKSSKSLLPLNQRQEVTGSALFSQSPSVDSPSSLARSQGSHTPTHRSIDSSAEDSPLPILPPKSTSSRSHIPLSQSTPRETVWMTPKEDRYYSQESSPPKATTGIAMTPIELDHEETEVVTTVAIVKSPTSRKRPLRTQWKVDLASSAQSSGQNVMWEYMLTNSIDPSIEESMKEEDEEFNESEMEKKKFKKDKKVTIDLQNEQYKTLTKQDFPNMEIIGQFNLGFIIAKHQEDLYILDQHACDEKYRFEKLQLSTKLHSQPLLFPLTIDTSPANEAAILDNLDIFAMNGFKLQVNHELENGAGRRIQLLSVPFSQGVQFGVQDVLELASMITDGYHDHVIESRGDVNKQYLLLKNDAVMSSTSKNSHKSQLKKVMMLPKLMATFASRACRSAVMIGTGLQQHEMKRLVSQLSGIEQPWNCPHGRPTMRHLVDLNSLT